MPTLDPVLEAELTFSITPSNTTQSKAATVTSSNISVAQVVAADDGDPTKRKIIACGPGTCTITAVSDGNPTLSKSCSITVKEVDPPGIKLQRTVLSLKPTGGSNLFTDVGVYGIAYSPTLNRIVFGYAGSGNVSGTMKYEAGYCYSTNAACTSFKTVPMFNYSTENIVPRCICWSPKGYFLAVNGNGIGDSQRRITSMHKSTDGISWTKVTFNANMTALLPDSYVYDLAWFGSPYEYFVLVGQNTVTRNHPMIWISQDGEYWSVADLNLVGGVWSLRNDPPWNNTSGPLTNIARAEKSNSSSLMTYPTLVAVSGQTVIYIDSWAKLVNHNWSYSSAGKSIQKVACSTDPDPRIVGVGTSTAYVDSLNATSWNAYSSNSVPCGIPSSAYTGYGISNMVEVTKFLYHEGKKVFALIASTQCNTSDSNYVFTDQALYTTRSGGNFMANDKWTKRVVQPYITSRHYLMTETSMTWTSSRSVIKDAIYSPDLDKIICIGGYITRSSAGSTADNVQLAVWHEV
jgi:hypothetical protein